MISPTRAFILQNTRLQRPPCVPELQLHLADEIMPVWRKVQDQKKSADAAPPFWAVAWAGGQAIARWLFDRPEEVSGKRVVDFATGSGLCAVAAMRAGAACALGVDIDPLSGEAIALNARANHVTVNFLGRDLLDADAPDCDVILAGDICYERSMASRVLSWLEVAHAQGARVLIGDPGRTYFPRERLVALAHYQVPTTRELEGMEVKEAGVFTFPA